MFSFLFNRVFITIALALLLGVGGVGGFKYYTVNNALNKALMDLNNTKVEKKSLQKKLDKAIEVNENNVDTILKLKKEYKTQLANMRKIQRDNAYLRKRREQLLSVINIDVNESDIPLRRKDINLINKMYPKAKNENN